MKKKEQQIPAQTDLLVLGSGAGGMSAALTGAALGLKVLIIEKTDQVGGTSARSAGSIWIPNTRHSLSKKDNFEKALTYLRKAVGNRLDEERASIFLKAGPEMVDFFENKSLIKLRSYHYHPDYLATLEGATLSGRVLEPLPFEGSILGKYFQNLRPPLPEFMLFGGMMVDRTDIAHLMNATKKPKSLWYSLKLLTQYGWDKIRYGRGTRLVMGNALIGRLYHSLLNHRVQVLFSTEVTSLTLTNDRVTGAVLVSGSKHSQIDVKAGIILATGGFSNNTNLRKSLMPNNILEKSCVIESATGDGLSLAKDVGGRLSVSHDSNSFWAPVSHRKRPDGSTAVFPHFVLDRGKPGLLAVDPTGKRFVNEATTYHLFGKALSTALKKFPGRGCFFICDDLFIKKYGLGMVRPKRIGLQSAIKNGYIVNAKTLEELALKIKIPIETLSATILKHNNYANHGIDKDFRKGEDAYQKNLGDALHKPNPCLGKLTQAPFYGLEVFPGDIGASAGLITNSSAQVLTKSNNPIEGLYACGNDMESIMAGFYPGPGITIGPAMTFGYVAARHAHSSLSNKHSIKKGNNK
jgi:succinate dehydrogenase/fumarate reductase flavoprotein subunit|tara:strand:+ start:1120 stop:2853 length:1734 start_codon:yes stop_codon:yes gene_type:complete